MMRRARHNCRSAVAVGAICAGGGARVDRRHCDRGRTRCLGSVGGPQPRLSSGALGFGLGAGGLDRLERSMDAVDGAGIWRARHRRRLTRSCVRLTPDLPLVTGPLPVRRARSACPMRAIDLPREMGRARRGRVACLAVSERADSAQLPRYACRVVSNPCRGLAGARPHTCSELRTRAEAVGGGGGSRTRVFRDVGGASPSASGMKISGHLRSPAADGDPSLSEVSRRVLRRSSTVSHS